MNIFIKKLMKGKNTKTDLMTNFVFLQKNLSIYLLSLLLFQKMVFYQQSHLNLMWTIHILVCLLDSSISYFKYTKSNIYNKIGFLPERF